MAPTGLSGQGKTTIAQPPQEHEATREHDRPVERDGDAIRQNLS
jgi:adenylylsulfate kinase-like enzyme